jgi:hypothetical protein
MEARDRLRLLSLEMDMQRDWLATYLDDAEVQASHRRSNVIWRLVMSVVQARSLWIAAFGIAAEWWRRRGASAA